MTPGGGELRRNPASGKLAIVAPARATRPADAAGTRRGRSALPLLRRQRGDDAAGGGRAASRRRRAGRPRLDECASCPTSTRPSPERHEVIVHSPDHDAELEDLGDGAPRRGPRHVAAPDRRAARRGRRRRDAHRQRRRRLGRLAGAPARAVVRDAGRAAAAVRGAARGRSVTATATARASSATRSSAPASGWCWTARWAPGCPRPAASTASCGWRRRRTRRTSAPPTPPPWRRRCAALLTAVKTSIGGAPLNFWLHTAPAELRGSFHWHLELAPRTATLAGFELGTDIALVTKAPEAAAAEYRAALPPA